MFGRNAVLKPVWDESHPARVSGSAVLGETLVVNSVWPTIQGEGPQAGNPAVFVRLTGCNLRCHFCDTEFEKGTEHTLDEIVVLIKIAMGVAKNCDLVVLTGGEPLRQQIIPLIARCADEGWYVQIETAGTVWPPAVMVEEIIHAGEMTTPARLVSLEGLVAADLVQLVCSPKTPKVHPKIEELCDHFKYIVRKGELDPDDGLPIKSTQIEGASQRLYRPDPENVIPTRWVQPCTEYRDSYQGIDGELPSIKVVDGAASHENMRECVRVALAHGYRISLQTHRILGVE